MKKRFKKVKIFKGGYKKDTRGILRFINQFKFKGIKRFYHIENANTDVLRAFHGHMREEKYVYVVSGKILLCAVPIDNKESPSRDFPVQRIILSSDQPTIAYIPGGYANGIKALEEDTKIIIFSSMTLKQSEKDSYRYDSDYWGKEIWNYE